MRSATIVALALAAVAGCGESRKAEAPAPAPAPTAAAADAAGPPPFRVEVVPPSAPCAREASCEAALRVTALRDFHVNAEYPTKFVAEPQPDVTAEPAATLALEGPQSGRLPVRFRSTRAGTVRVNGVFKLSVCNEGSCVIENVPVAIEAAIL